MTLTDVRFGTGEIGAVPDPTLVRKVGPGGATLVTPVVSGDRIEFLVR